MNKKFFKFVLFILINIQLLSVGDICFASDSTKYYVNNIDFVKKILDLESKLDSNFMFYSSTDVSPFLDYVSGITDCIYANGYFRGTYKIEVDDKKLDEIISYNTKKFLKEYVGKADGVMLRLFEPEGNPNRAVIAEAFYKLIFSISPEARSFDVNKIEDFADEEDCIGRERAIKYMVYNGYMKVFDNNEFRPFDYMEYSTFTNMISEIYRKLKK